MNEERMNAIRFITKALAIVGVVALFSTGLWGSVQVAKNVPGALSTLGSAIVGLTSVFVPADEELRITLTSTTLESGEPFTLSFVHEGRGKRRGSYRFAYSCHQGFTFEAPSQQGTFSIAACETPLSLGNESAVRLVPVSNNARFRDVVVGVHFLPDEANGRAELIATQTITIVNSDAAQSSSTIDAAIAAGSSASTAAVRDALLGAATAPEIDTASPTTERPTPVVGERESQVFPVSPGVQPSNPLGQPDLLVRILALGIMDGETFTATSSVPAGKDAAVQFEIENAGTKDTGEWSFNAVLPTSPIHIFTSPTQRSLAPGDKIIYTLGFNRARGGDAEFVVNADPRNNIGEASEENNIRRIVVDIL